MARFQVTQRYPDGRTVQAELEADDEEAVWRRARAEGWTPVALQSTASPASFRFGGGGRFPLTLFGYELKTLLEAGLPITEVLGALQERAGNEVARVVLARLTSRIESGEALSTALAREPEHFPPLFVATIRSGERTGDLPRVIGRYLAYSEQLGELKRQLVSAAVYPGLLLTVGSAVIIFMLIYLVPRFSVIYEQIQGDLSWPARLLLHWGLWAREHTSWLVLGLIALPAAIVSAARQPAVRLWLAERLQQSSLIGRYWRLFGVSRYCRSLALLIGGGIPIPEAMRLAAGVLPLTEQPRLTQAMLAIQQGERLSDALARHNLMSPIVIRLLRAGERSGDVARMLEQAADFHDREMRHLLERLTKVVEPLLMLLIGLAIGGIVVLMYLPIFELAGSLKT